MRRVVIGLVITGAALGGLAPAIAESKACPPRSHNPGGDPRCGKPGPTPPPPPPPVCAPAGDVTGPANEVNQEVVGGIDQGLANSVCGVLVEVNRITTL